MKKAIFLKSVSTVVGASSGLLASVASASCGAETKYTEGEILIQRTDLYLVGDADNLTGLIKSITFNIVGLKNQSLSDAKMHFQIEKYAVDYLPNELKNALQIKQTYDSKNNIVTVEVQVEDGWTDSKFNLCLFAINGNSISNKQNYTVWLLPYKWNDFATLFVGQNFTVRDKFDARYVINYIKLITDKPNTTYTYNEVWDALRWTFQDLLNCLLGIGVCPFEMPSQLSATVYDQTINQKSVTKDQQNLSHVSTPVGAELNPSSFQPNLATGSSFMGGRNAKRVAALYNWTNGQMWVDALYGAAWKVLSNGSRFVTFDWKGNNNEATSFDKGDPIVSLANIYYDASAMSSDNPVFKDPIVSFPFARQYTINPQETINVNDQYSPMPTVFEQQLEALYRNGGLFYLGQVDPSKNGQFFIETTSESSIRIDPDNSSNFVYSGYILNGPNVTIYPDISTLSLQFVNLEVTFNLRNFFLPSYWLSADNQLEPGLWITDTFLD